MKAIWLGAHPLCWDQSLLSDTLDGHFAPVGLTEHTVVDAPLPLDPAIGEAVVVVPARYFSPAAINSMLAPLARAVVFLTSDEEATFPADAIHHPDAEVFVQTPRAGWTRPDRWMPVGYTGGTRAAMAAMPPTEGWRWQWVFAGQVTHPRRQAAVKAMAGMRPGEMGRLIETPSFTAGLPHGEYLRLLRTARIAPCPSGPVGIDTFRMWEALEAGCVPIVDRVSPIRTDDYWGCVLDEEAPFPLITDWSMLPLATELIDERWEWHAARCSGWWGRWRLRFSDRVRDLIRPPISHEDQVTVIVTTSPIPAHPDTSMLEQTVASIRAHLPTARILIAADDVRPEQMHLAAGYDTYLHRVAELCARRWWNVGLDVAPEWLHQARLTERVLRQVTTPTILFMEHDTPLTAPDEGPIDWAAAVAAVADGALHVIRFHHESRILEVHEHLMLDGTPIEIAGVPVMRTRQWSQRPHLANRDFYRRMLGGHLFPAAARTMIEDRVHGPAQEEGWDAWRLAIYTPGGSTLRSRHLDGRGEEPKFEMRW